MPLAAVEVRIGCLGQRLFWVCFVVAACFVMFLSVFDFLLGSSVRNTEAFFKLWLESSL